MNDPKCLHVNLTPGVIDQTLGVYCPDCDFSEACWGVEHSSESVWNMACKNDSEFTPCNQNRHDVCFLCGEKYEENIE